jgi:RNA polymerase sigma factor (sigma-70 family)
MKAGPRTSDWSDEQLVERCLAGDQRAWTALLERYSRLVYSVPVKYRMQPEDAADIFQAVWVDVYAELGRLRQVGALRSWLVTVTAHKCFHWKRQRERTETSLEDLNGEVTDQRSLAPSVQEEVEREQLLRDAIAALPERCQTMVKMLFYRHPPLPYNEVANLLGLAEGSIGFIRGRCLKKLRKELEDRGF